MVSGQSFGYGERFTVLLNEVNLFQFCISFYTHYLWNVNTTFKTTQKMWIKKIK